MRDLPIYGAIEPCSLLLPSRLSKSCLVDVHETTEVRSGPHARQEATG